MCKFFPLPYSSSSFEVISSFSFFFFFFSVPFFFFLDFLPFFLSLSLSLFFRSFLDADAGGDDESWDRGGAKDSPPSSLHLLILLTHQNSLRAGLLLRTRGDAQRATLLCVLFIKIATCLLPPNLRSMSRPACASRFPHLGSQGRGRQGKRQPKESQKKLIRKHRIPVRSNLCNNYTDDSQN